MEKATLTITEKITLLSSNDKDRVNAQKLANASEELLDALIQAKELIEILTVNKPNDGSFVGSTLIKSINAINKATK